MGFKNMVVSLAILLAIVFTGCSNGENKNVTPNESKGTNKSNVTDESKETTESKETNISKEIKEEKDPILSLDGGEFNLTKQFENEYLKELSLKELSLLRNSIYAKNGYEFSTKEFLEYYSQFSWYTPSSKDVDSLLNKIDNENIKNIMALEQQSESMIKNSKDDKELSTNGDGTIHLYGPAENERLYITREELDYDGGNFPTKITLKTYHNKKVFESTWNDGLFVSVVDFNDRDEELDIYITETGTDIACTTHIYKISGGSIYPYTSFVHFGKDFLYDEKGNIYYWFNTSDERVINTCFNYKTQESGDIWDQSIKNSLNNLFKDTEVTKKNTNETNSSIEDDKKVISADLKYYKDLDYDGNKEEINIVFKYDDREYSCGFDEYTISIKSNGQSFKYEETNAYIWDYELKFIRCEEKIYFYVQDEGPSDDPNATIYELTEGGINVALIVCGNIIDSDYDGNIYTTYSYADCENKVLLSYYNIKEGLKYPSNEEIIGKYLQYDSNMVIFEKESIRSDYRVSWASEERADEIRKSISRGDEGTGIVTVTDINEPLKIVEVGYNFYEGYTGIVRNIPIKVETKDGLTGWLFWLNGGD